MKGIMLWLAAIALLAGGLSALALAPDKPIGEDDSRWDCRTMGNHVCGVETDQGVFLVTFDNNGQPVNVAPRGF